MIALRSQMFALWCLLTLAGSAFAQDEWARVTALDTSVTVQIETASQRLRGTVRSITETGLSVDVSGRSIDILRSDVRRVVRIGGRQVKRYAIRGLVMGAAAGATLGATTGSPDRGKGQWSAIMAAGWGGIGALIGAINGLDRKEELVYQAAADSSRQPRSGEGGSVR